MKTCQHIQKQFIEACYHELDDTSRKQFDAHLSTCAACQNAFEEMKTTLQVVSSHHVPENDDAYWDGYWDKLSDKITRRKPKTIKHPIKRFQPSPSVRWVLGVAFALVVGIFIGRMDLKKSSDSSNVIAVQNQTAQFASVQNDAARYLERSKLILLGITNTDVDPSNFSLQQSKSAELVSLAEPLKESLSENNQYMLAELISELELILMQIANLENKHDIEGIELIQAGSEQRALLFKINIGEMHLSSDQPSPESGNETTPVI